MESDRLERVTRANIAEHIARVQEAMRRFHIYDPRFIFNLEESGVSFKNIPWRSLQKGIGPSEARLQSKAVIKKGKLVRVTVMCVVNAAGESFKPVIVYPGKQPHFRRVHGRYESVVNALLPCHFLQRDPPGVNTQIFYEWAKHFVEETSHLRDGGRNCYSY